MCQPKSFLKQFLVFTLLFISSGASGQTFTCDPNIDFEFGDYRNWTFYQGTCCSPLTISTLVSATTSASAGRIGITSSTTTTDPYGGFPIVAPGGGSYSLKIGQTEKNYKADKARYYIHVPSGSTDYALIFRYAVVLEDPVHAAANQPRFIVNTRDSLTGDTISCGNFTYIASGTLPGFTVSKVSKSWYYKPWSTAIIKLSGYAGRTVIIDFARGNCGLGAHSGYGYVDMTCGLFAIAKNSCEEGGFTNLTGPPGFNSYKWMDSAMTTTLATTETASIPTPAVTTVYKLIVSPYVGYGCPDTLTTKIIISNLKVVARDTFVCRGKSVSLSAGVSGDTMPSISSTYKWTPSTGLSCSNCLNPTVTGDKSTAYVFSASDSNGCIKRDTANLTVNYINNYKGIRQICKGDSTFITASPSLTHFWNPTAGLSCSTCPSAKASPLVSTSYTIDIADTNGCINIDSVFVKVNPIPDIYVPDFTICKRDTTVLYASGAPKYVWSPSTELSCDTCTNPLAYPISTGTFNVTGIDTNGCTDKDTFLFKVLALPNVIASDKSICKGDSVKLSVSGASTYVWSPVSGLSCSSCREPMASPSVTTTYVVTGTDTNTCKNKDTVLLSVNMATTSNGGNKTICYGDSATLSVGGAVSYAWFPVTGLACNTCGTTKASPLVTTTYVVISTDSNLCTKRDTIVLKVNPLPNVVAPDKAVCTGDTAVLSVSGASSYSWSPSVGLSCTGCPNPTANTSLTTNYVVTGLDSNTCSNKDTMVFKVNPLPRINATNKSICLGNTAIISASGASTYVWSPATGLSCTSCSSPVVTTSSSMVYIVTGTDTNSCVGKDTAFVQVNPLPVVKASDKIICSGDSALLSATGAARYLWSPATGLSCTDCLNPSAGPGATTEYIVTGMDSMGCKDDDTLIVKVNVRPSINTSNKTICFGDSTLLAVTSTRSDLNYSWNPSTGLACNTCKDTKASPAVTTSYVITAIDSNGCTDKDTIVVTVHALPVLNSADKTICYGDSTLLTVSGAATYNWSPTTGLYCNTCAGTKASPATTTKYIITGTDINSCVSKDTLTVTVNPLPVLNSTDKIICFHDSASLNVSGALSYLWSPATGLSCSNCADPKASPLSTSTYVITGTDANSCSNKDTLLVKVNPLPVINSSTDKVLCLGDSALLSTTGATNYSWTPATGLSCSNCSNPVAKPTITTRYIITGTDTNLCFAKDTIQVKVNPLPNINSTDKTICRGDTVSLNASGGASYVWSPGTGLSCITCANPLAMPLTTTNYVITGTDSNSCINKDTIMVKVNALPAVSANDKVICFKDSTILNASGAESYTWSPSTGLTCSVCASPKASPAFTTTYVIVGKDSNSCSNKDTIVLKVNPLPNVNSTDKKICYADTTTLLSSGASNYVWSPATGLVCSTCPSTKASPAITTQYIITGTDTNNCSNKDTIEVKVNPLPKVWANDKVICFGKSATLNANGAYTYFWSPSIGLSCATCANPVATSALTTSYILIGTDTNACSNKDTVIVTVNALPVLNSSTDKTICYGDSVALFSSGVSTYVWSPVAGLSCSTCPNPMASPKTTTSYMVLGIDSNSCEDKDTIEVKVNPLPVLLSSDQTICKGFKAVVSVSGAERYVWSPSSYLSCDTCAFASASPDHTISYEVKGTDANGCMRIDTVLVTVNNPLEINVDSIAPICYGERVTMRASGTNFYLWSPSSGLSCATCDITDVIPETSMTYTVIGTDTNTCKDTAKLTIIVNPKPVLHTSADSVLCEGSRMQLFASGSDSYLWTPETGLSCTTCDSPFTNASNSITYTVIGSNSYGCTDTAEIHISVFKKQAITFAMGDTICSGQQAKLFAGGGSSYLWIPSDGLSNDTIPDPVASPDKSTIYKVIIRQGNCFVDTASVSLLVYPTPTVSISGDTDLYIGEMAHLYSSGTHIEKYIWSPATNLNCSDCPNPIATLEQTTSFLLVVKGPGDCESQDTITVRVKCDQAQVFIPNTFTPNADGENDRFYPMGSGVKIIKDFSVYNRWGELMYQVHDIALNSPEDGWDGSFKGKQLTPDVFIYYITATCLAGEEIKFKGNISLVK